MSLMHVLKLNTLIAVVSVVSKWTTRIMLSLYRPCLWSLFIDLFHDHNNPRLSTLINYLMIQYKPVTTIH